ncbi:hypothetical protein AGMMS50268_21260 [Spirochaetia bacterium]|nr:hypothetical protein AGMMS50268_21260 [Spirochaetia bacterium]
MKKHSNEITTIDPILSAVRKIRDESTDKNRAQVLRDVETERIRQIEKWGEQNWPMAPKKIGMNGTPTAEYYGWQADRFRAFNNRTKDKTWHDILCEEVAEVFAETEPEKQREEMVQVAAVAVQIIEYLDRKRKI